MDKDFKEETQTEMQMNLVQRSWGDSRKIHLTLTGGVSPFALFMRNLVDTELWNFSYNPSNAFTFIYFFSVECFPKKNE